MNSSSSSSSSSISSSSDSSDSSDSSSDTESFSKDNLAEVQWLLSKGQKGHLHLCKQVLSQTKRWHTASKTPTSAQALKTPVPPANLGPLAAMPSSHLRLNRLGALWSRDFPTRFLDQWCQFFGARVEPMHGASRMIECPKQYVSLDYFPAPSKRARARVRDFSCVAWNLKQ